MKESLTLIPHLLWVGKRSRTRKDQKNIGISTHWNLMKVVAHPQTEWKNLAREGSVIGGQGQGPLLLRDIRKLQAIIEGTQGGMNPALQIASHSQAAHFPANGHGTMIALVAAQMKTMNWRRPTSVVVEEEGRLTQMYLELLNWHDQIFVRILYTLYIMGLRLHCS